MGGGEGLSLCSDPLFRQKFGALAGDRARVEPADWDVIRKTFQLSSEEESLLQSFKERLQSEQPLKSHEIRTLFIGVLNSILKQRRRVSSFGLVDFLFGEGNWDRCFPNLERDRAVQRRKTLDLLKGENPPNPAHQDTISIINIPFIDLGMKLRCYQWGEGREDYLCAEAEHLVEEEEDYDFFFFRGEPVGGKYKSDAYAQFDSRRTMAIYSPNIERDLKEEYEGEATPWVVKVAGWAAAMHELEHSRQRYVDSRFDTLVKEKFGWEDVYDFGELSREITAEIAELKKFEGGKVVIDGKTVSDEIAFSIFKALNITPNKGEGEYPKNPFQFFARLLPLVQDAEGKIDFKKLMKKMEEVKTFFSSFEKEFQFALDQELRSFYGDARKHWESIDYFPKLDPKSQQERIDHKAVELFLEARPEAAKGIRNLILRWRERSNELWSPKAKPVIEPAPSESLPPQPPQVSQESKGCSRCESVETWLPLALYYSPLMLFYRR